jgi:hypothetical protein
MDGALEREVRERAAGLCEYCHLLEIASLLRHVVDHVIARQHGGADSLSNLALCCGRCNLYKGPNIAGFDPETGALTPLFNPRNDTWQEHFRWNGPALTGLTPVGRTTIRVLAINHPSRVAARRMFITLGQPPQS